MFSFKVTFNFQCIQIETFQGLEIEYPGCCIQIHHSFTVLLVALLLSPFPLHTCYPFPTWLKIDVD